MRWRSRDPNIFYGWPASGAQGLHTSTDGGKIWIKPRMAGLTVIYRYRVLKSAPSLYRSADNGQTWEQLGNGTSGVILQLAIAPSNPQILYAVNENNAVFQSQDSCKTWKEMS